VVVRLQDLPFKAMNQAHQAILRLSGGRVLTSVLGMPAVKLETKGRKSGLARTTMLTAPVVEGDRVVRSRRRAAPTGTLTGTATSLQTQR
jgi:hypothetical protein